MIDDTVTINDLHWDREVSILWTTCNGAACCEIRQSRRSNRQISDILGCDASHELDAGLEELKITSQISVYAMRLGPEIQLLSKIYAVLGLTEKRKP